MQGIRVKAPFGEIETVKVPWGSRWGWAEARCDEALLCFRPGVGPLIEVRVMMVPDDTPHPSDLPNYIGSIRDFRGVETVHLYSDLRETWFLDDPEKMTIWKLVAGDCWGITIHNLPADRKPLTAQLQRELVVVWFEVNPEAPDMPVRLELVPTGGQPELPTYVGTVQLHGGSVVAHVYCDTGL